MSKTIDEKIVEMKFDNSDFEKNVKTSMSTLDKLKEALNFKGAKKGIEEVADASEKLNFKTTADGIQKVQYKFNAMYALTAKIFDRLSDKALNMVKSMSVDQVAAGMQKYEEKIRAVQTIMSATGRSIEEVTEQLDILNWFSDETSYSFTDMASNVGKFTAAGVKLEDAVNAMQGIANWAAISGQNAQAASRAMYNLSQSMGVGYVNLMDWKSIENANMGTIAFKETALETAAALGVLVKAGEDASGVMQYYNEATQEFYNALNFRESLADKWFTRDVLEVVLNEYGAYASAIKMVQDRMEFDTASQTMQVVDQFIKRENIDGSVESLEKMADALHINIEEAQSLYETYNSVGKEAFEAAQRAKTWTDVLGATRDAVSSSWMRAFEAIFGDFKDAKALFTDMANEMWNIFAGPVDAFASSLSEAMNHQSAWETIKDFLGADDIGKTADDWEKALLKVTDGLEYTYGKTIDLTKAVDDPNRIVDAKYNLQELINRFGSLEKVTERGYITMEDYRNALKELGVEFNLSEEDAEEFENALYALTEKGGRVKLIESLGHIYNVLKKVFGAIQEAFTNVFSTPISERISRFIDHFYNLAKSLEITEEASQAITSAFEGIFKGLRVGLNILSSVVSAIMSVVGTIVPYIAKAFAFVFGVVSERIGGVADMFDTIAEYFRTKFDEIGEEIKNSKTLNAIKDAFATAKSYVVGAWQTIVETIGSVNANSVIEFFDTLGGTIMAFANTVLKSDIVSKGIGAINTAVAELGKNIKNFKMPTLQEATENIASFFNSFEMLAPEDIGNAAARIKQYVSSKVGLKFRELTEQLGQVYGNSKSFLGKALDWLIRIVRKISLVLSNFVSFSLQSIYIATKKILRLAQMFAAFKLMMSTAKLMDAISGKLKGDRAGGIEGVLTSLAGVFKRLGLFLIELTALVYIFGKMDPSVTEKGFAALGVIFGGIFAFMIAILGLRHGLSEGNIYGIALTIAALGVAVKLIADALQVLTTVKINFGGLVGLGAVLAGFYFFIKALSGLGKDRIKGALPLIALASGLKMMLSVIEEYSKFNWAANIKGMLTIIPMMLFMVQIVKSLKGGEKLNTLAFVGMALALKMMVSTIEDLGSLPFGVLLKGTATLYAITKFIVMLTDTIKQLDSGAMVSGEKMKSKISSFIGIVILLLAATAAIVILGKQPVGQLIAGTAAVSRILYFLSVLIKSIASLQSVSGWKMAGILAEVVLVLASLAAIYRFLLADADYDHALDALMMMTAMVAEIVVLALTAALLGQIPPGVVDNGIAVLTKAAAFLGALTLIVDAVAIIASFALSEERLTKAATTAALLGNIVGALIGGFFGGLQGGAAEAYASHMPRIAGYLSDFSEKIGGFIDFVTSTGNSAKTTTFTEFMNAITSLVEGLAKISKKDKDLGLLPHVGNQLREFMMNLIQNGYFFSGLDTVDAKQIEAAKVIAQIIEALMPISRGQGLKALWEGSASPAKMAENLSGYAESISTFAKKVNEMALPTDILDKVDLFGDIAYRVIELFNHLPQGTGIVDWLLGGSTDWKTVGNNFGWFRGVINNFVEDLQTNDNYNKNVKDKVKIFGEIVGVIIESFQKLSSISNGVSLSLGDFFALSIGNSDWQTIGKGLEDFVTSIKNFIYGITEIDTNTEYGTIGEKVTAIVDAINSTIDNNSQKLEFTGQVLGDRMMNGMNSAFANIDNTIVWFVEKYQSGFGVYNDDFEVLGMNIVERMVKGMEKVKDQVRTGAASLGAAANTALRIGWANESSIWNKFYLVGQFAAEGLDHGMNSWYAKNLVATAGSRLGRMAYDAAKKAIESNSPSKKFMQLGEWSAEGYSIGVTDSLGMVTNAMDRMGETSLDSLQNAMSTLSTGLDIEDSAPVIRPVLDLSDVNSGLTGLMSSNYSLGIGSTTRSLTNSIKNQNGGNVVASAIADLKEDLNSMKDEMLGMRIVMDSGALVGSISTKMDSALGTISTYKGRGNI